MTKHLPRPTRVALRPLHAVFFHPAAPPSTPVGARTISISGLGLQREDRAEWPAPGTAMRGELALGEERFALELRVVHLSDEIVGCAFQGDVGELTRAIARRFNVERAAAEATRVNPALITQPENGTATWFQGAQNCELYFETDAVGLVTSFHLSVFGNYLECDERGRLLFGREVDEGPRDKPGYKGSPVVGPGGASGLRDARADAAVRFVEGLPGLAREHAAQIVTAIAKGCAAK